MGPKTYFPLMACLGMLLSWAPKAQESFPAEILAYPDLILFNAKVVTADDRFTVAEAVAVRDGRFLAVGSNDRIVKLAGPNTQRLDLGGKTVVPGFINSHLHLAEQRMAEPWERADGADFDKKKSIEKASAVLEGVRKAAAVRPGKWIVKYYSGRFREAVLEGELTKEKLDAAAPDNPVALGYMTDSFWLLNNRGIKEAEFEPEIGGLRKDPETGEPTGIVTGDAAFVVAYEIASWVIPVDETMSRIREATKRVNAQGITTIHTRVSSGGLTAVRNLWSQGGLTLRWRIALTGARAEERFSEKFFQRLGNLTGIGDDMVRIVGFAPGGVDGSPEAGRGWTWTPKLRVMPGTFQDPFGYEEAVAKATLKNIRIAARYGWNVVGIHSIGDRSTSEAIASYEEGKKESTAGNKDQRLRVDHLMIVRPEDLKKMKDLDVVPSVAAWHMFVPVNTMVHQYGADSVNNMVRARSFIEAGLKPVGENSSYHPLWNIERHVTRKDKDGRVWGPHEKVTRQEAVWMHTNWVAHYTGEPEKLGTIEPGKLADLAVIDGDLMKVPDEEISKLQVVMTILGGKIVYDKERDGFVAPADWGRERVQPTVER